MKINEVARLSGVTVRTLHYYDEIGLLKPSEVTEAGYRIYDAAALARLQQILFFRELSFPLDEISRIISCPGFDQKQALKNHRKLLIKKRERLERLVMLVDKIVEGESEMSFKEFDNTEIEDIKAKYSAEVNERWGNTDAFAQSEEKTAKYGDEEWQQVKEEGGDILKAVAKCRGKAPESAEVQALVLRWQQHITNRFYNCNKEILQGLGEMYTADERFRQNIDQNGEGTAELLAQGIKIYCGE